MKVAFDTIDKRESIRTITEKGIGNQKVQAIENIYCVGARDGQ